MLMRLEGIDTASVSGYFSQYPELGHVLSGISFDGKEFFCDWGNGISLAPRDTLERVFSFDEASLQAVRSGQIS